MTRALPDRRTGPRDGVGRGPSADTARALRRVEPGRRRELVQFLARLGDAFAAGDLTAIAACHVPPLLYVTEWGSAVFTSTREVAEGFRQVVDDHRRRGLVSPTSVVETVSTPAARIVEIGVRWTFHDAEGRALLHDRYRYLLRRVDGEGLLINAVIVLGGRSVAP
ncbi:hypothetical protein EV188_10178 [Actinomycetospora succinea]|uniref:SnoaL-like protein n=1 Tax=Actinomycetospora succinea TaxID=663603 RepID=A0A4R6VNG7_9PSEU|nr:hypothetical protein [Actinomycetospora succinea]TDQ64831.1 hypothetical protein EV188_10178 [Actinomycetospora succinea]